jgi:hypothetical protein
MATCEKCWADAYVASRTLGGSQPDHYRRLLNERAAQPCPTPARGDEAVRDA